MLPAPRAGQISLTMIAGEWFRDRAAAARPAAPRPRHRAVSVCLRQACRPNARDWPKGRTAGRFACQPLLGLNHFARQCWPSGRQKRGCRGACFPATAFSAASVPRLVDVVGLLRAAASERCTGGPAGLAGGCPIAPRARRRNSLDVLSTFSSARRAAADAPRACCVFGLSAAARFAADTSERNDRTRSQADDQLDRIRRRPSSSSKGVHAAGFSLAVRRAASLAMALRMSVSACTFRSL